MLRLLDANPEGCQQRKDRQIARPRAARESETQRQTRNRSPPDGVDDIPHGEPSVFFSLLLLFSSSSSFCLYLALYYAPISFNRRSALLHQLPNDFSCILFAHSPAVLSFRFGSAPSLLTSLASSAQLGKPQHQRKRQKTLAQNPPNQENAGIDVCFGFQAWLQVGWIGWSVLTESPFPSTRDGWMGHSSGALRPSSVPLQNSGLSTTWFPWLAQEPPELRRFLGGRGPGQSGQEQDSRVHSHVNGWAHCGCKKRRH